MFIPDSRVHKAKFKKEIVPAETIHGNTVILTHQKRNSITRLTLTSNIEYLFNDRMKDTRAFQTDAPASQRTSFFTSILRINFDPPK